MSVPCCYSWSTGEPLLCYDSPSPELCRSVQHGEPGPEGTRCYDPNFGQAGCYSCNRRGISDITGGCCFPGEVYHVTWQSNCDECGGFPSTAAECSTEYPQPEGIEPREDRPSASGFRWTIDLIGTAALGLDHTPSDRGFVYPLTDHLIRAATELDEPEPCQHLRGHDVMLEDGYVYTEVCSRAMGQLPSSRRVSYGAMMTAEDEPRLRDGYQYDIASIHLPYWTEAIVRSHKRRCGGWDA